MPFEIVGSSFPPISTRAVGANMARKTKGMTRKALKDMLIGVAKHFPADHVFTIAGKKYPMAALEAVFQAHLDALDAVDAAHTALRVAVAHEKDVGRAAKAVAQPLEHLLRGTHGGTATMLADFGWKPAKKPGPKTVASKLAGVEKRAATRKARGTMGARQRKKIKGAKPG